MSRVARVCIISLVLALGFAGVAEAQAAFKSTNTSGFTYRGSKCAWGSTTLDNMRAPIAMSSIGTSDATYSSQCDGTEYQSPPMDLALRQDLLFWYNGSWNVCNQGPWVQNQTPSHAVSTGYAWGRAPCYDAYYRSGTWVLTWIGGGLYWQGGEFMGNDWVINR